MKKSTLYWWHTITLAATIFYSLKSNFHLFDIVYNIWFYFSCITFSFVFLAYFSTIVYHEFGKLTWMMNNDKTITKEFSVTFFNKFKREYNLTVFTASVFPTLIEIKKKIIESYQKNEHMNLYADIIYYLTIISFLLYAELYFFASVWVLKSIFDFKMRYDNRPIKPIIV